jgi:hypothetical protein
MTRTWKKLLFMALLACVFSAGPAMAGADGKVEWRSSSGEPRKNVIIRQGGDTLIIRTDPRAADRLQKMLDKKKGRVIIRSRGFTYYPDDYYPYYRDKGPAYSVGRAVGRKMRDDDDD